MDRPHPLKQPATRYRLPARILHWLMAAGFLFMWCCGYAMEELVADESALQELLLGLHISVGVTLGFLLALRFAVRIEYPPPPLPPGLSDLERRGARLAHAALYALPAAAIAAGWAETDFGGHGVEWFGVPMPKLFPSLGEGAEELAGDVHLTLVYLMLAASLAHVAAAVKHRFDGNDVLPRMTLGRRTHD